MTALRVGDCVLYQGKTWRVTSLGRDAFRREGDRMTANDELHAILLLAADLPGTRTARPPYSTVLCESKWDEATVLSQ
jgi:hypothetical protein